VNGYGDRHRLPVGLTGLAQIHGLRGDTSIMERARFDNYYIEHWSPWHDLKIVVRTITSIIRDALDRSSARRP
jgi:lipopolysaccharide/colanic/teichoic acid biosynthesis glycosyltransferase